MEPVFDWSSIENSWTIIFDNRLWKSINRTTLVLTQFWIGKGPILDPKSGLGKSLNVYSLNTGPHGAVGNMSGYRGMPDCRSRDCELDPSPVSYFRGDWSWNYFYGHSPPFHWIIQEGLLSVTSESMCTMYWLTTCSSLPRKKCG